jgi:hypothetical protein
VLAHFRNGRSAARAITDLEARGVAVAEVYVVAAGEAELLARIGVAPADAHRAAAESTPVVVAVAVANDCVADCLAVLGERAEAIGVPAAGRSMFPLRLGAWAFGLAGTLVLAVHVARPIVVLRLPLPVSLGLVPGAVAIRADATRVRSARRRPGSTR